ncbi:MAG: hypothetical protein ACTSPV_15925 [Candidatus Hodarchaeales archaeon]
MNQTDPTNIPRFDEVFLSSIDEFLAENCTRLKGTDIYDMYFNFFNELKKYRCNSSGFTGLSEFLIFRLLYHGLGGNRSFELKESTQDTFFFQSKDDTGLMLYQGTKRFKIEDSKTIRPDIVITKNNDLVGVIEIKIYLSNSFKTATSVINRCKQLRVKNASLKTYFVLYDLGLAGTHSEIERELVNLDWMDFTILKYDNKALLPKFLQFFSFFSNK